MLDRTNERLAGIRARLRDALKMATKPDMTPLTISVNMQIVLDALNMAINKVVPNMPASAAAWVVPMLWDAAESASGEGEKDLAFDLHYEANTLRGVSEEFSDN